MQKMSDRLPKSYLYMAWLIGILIVQYMHGKWPFQSNGKNEDKIENPSYNRPSKEFNALVKNIHGDEFVPEYNGFKPVEASVEGNTVVYTDGQGQQIVKTGGTRAFRNNNPGNIEYKESTWNYPGVIGHDGRFCIFETLEHGTHAMYLRLRSDRTNHGDLTPDYASLTIEKAIHQWCPPKESNGTLNNTEGYVRFVVEHSGLAKSRIVGSLNEEEFSRLVAAMIKKEGGMDRGQTLATTFSVIGLSSPIAPEYPSAYPPDLYIPFALG